jgi:hypothetical protein
MYFNSDTIIGYEQAESLECSVPGLYLYAYKCYNYVNSSRNHLKMRATGSTFFVRSFKK